MPAEIPRSEQMRHVGGLCRTWRGRYGEPIKLATFKGFQLPDHQEVMQRRLEAAIERPFRQAFPNAPPPKKLPGGVLRRDMDVHSN